MGDVGLDVGSTTVKIAVRIGPQGPWATRAARHHGRPAEAVLGLCDAMLPEAFRLRVTGSSAPLVATPCGAETVHEVAAAMGAARALHPEVATLIDLGGQDAKLVLLDRDGAGAHPCRPVFVMNDRCAAGTGVTLDRCLGRLGVSFAAARGMPYRPDATAALSARCGVFAETDLVNLARRGVAPEVLVSSLVDAIVQANLAVLARGLTPRPPVLLLGGPHAHLPALTEAWRRRLGELWQERGVAPGLVLVPDEALYFPALGAALGAAGTPCRAPSQRPAVLRALGRPLDPPSSARDVPFASTLHAQIERPAWPEGSRTDRPLGAGPAGGFVLGIDAGSTVTKAVLLDAERTVHMTSRRASGDPVVDARGILDEARGALDRVDPAAFLQATVVTGYGAAWMAPLVGADAEVVETVAHTLSARVVAPEADLVCDVGGQDIKVLSLDPDGALLRFEVSSRCNAGIGLALESTSRELGIRREAFSAQAFEATRAPWFGDACVVFLDADRVSFQRQGFTPQEILAGLARALPRIVWTQVVRGAPIASLGRVLVLQGGVQHNEAAVWAQAEHIAAEAPEVRIVVHPLPDLAGALGAALHGLAGVAQTRGAPTQPSRPTRPARRAVSLAQATTREADPCTLCENRCPRTRIDVPAPLDGRTTTLVGQGCPAGDADDPAEGAPLRRALDHAVPDLYSAEATSLFRVDAAVQALAAPRHRVRIAIPRVLALYRAAPLLRAYLQGLGVAPRDIRFSPPTDATLWRRGAHHGATDPCFPTRVVLAHVHRLLAEGPWDVLFVPRVTHAPTPVRHGPGSASCPVVAASPAIVQAAFGRTLTARGITLLDPELCLTQPTLLAAQLYEAFGPRLGVTRTLSDQALEQGAQAAARYDHALRTKARAVLDATRGGRGAVLVLGRPYHVDPGISHHLGVELQNLGFPSLSLRALPREEGWLAGLLADDLARGAIADPFDIRDLHPDCDNSGSAERLWGARVATRHGALGLVDLSSFKCAQDAPTSLPIARLVRETQTPFCALHDLDETRPRTSLRLALRTFAHSMRQRGLAPWT